MNINQLFDDLASNNSRIYKISKLEEAKRQDSNNTLKKTIQLALDPFTQFYIRKIPPYVLIDDELRLRATHNYSLDHALEDLGKLSAREYTGNLAVEHLRWTLGRLVPDDAKVVERILAKDLRCGVSIATVNTVWPELISEYPCMLCSAFKEKLLNKITFPASVQMKMDGMRFNALVKDGAVEFRSRNGKEMHLLGNLEAEFLALTKAMGPDSRVASTWTYSNMVFDGELMVMDTHNQQFLDRQSGNGILNKSNKGTISDIEAAQIHVSLWDAIAYKDFTCGYSNVPYGTRFKTLTHAMQKFENTKLHLVYNKYVDNIDQAKTEFNEILASGQEGIILKNLDSPWENKRAKHQIKFKGELECDLKIVAVEPGTGKYKGMLGAIVCESADGILQVSVGSGFNDNHRKTLGDELIGKIVAVKYNCRSINKQNEHSLFLPVFVEIREDKDNADNNTDIK